MISRRDFIKTGVVTAGALSFGPAFWRETLAAPAKPGAGPYGPLGAADSNGIAVPSGFKAREIARGNVPVQGTSYPWHVFPDAMATYRTDDGGWILVSNSEAPPDLGIPGQENQREGGASSIVFDRDGQIKSAYRILSNTSTNCAGGPTPWGTWLSCEEHGKGLVWECDPTGKQQAKSYPAMGVFDHEAAAVDGDRRRVYLSEDDAMGGFYRYTPTNWPDLSAGKLEVASRQADSTVVWLPVPDPSGAQTPLREQVPDYTPFQRGEGLWFDSGVVYLSTTNDNKIHAFDVRRNPNRHEYLYDGEAIADPAITRVDNVTASPISGDIFVCEDNSESSLDIGILSREGEVARFLTVSGSQHTQSELAGVCFDPSGSRMYFASQRAFGPGVVYEVSGPFRTVAPGGSGSAKVSSARTASLEGFVKRGLTVGLINADGAGEAKLVLRATVRSSGRSRTITLARRTVDVEDNRLEVDLMPSRSVRRRLRGRSTLTATLDVILDPDGAKTRLRRRTIRFR